MNALHSDRRHDEEVDREMKRLENAVNEKREQHGAEFLQHLNAPERRYYVETMLVSMRYRVKKFGFHGCDRVRVVRGGEPHEGKTGIFLGPNYGMLKVKLDDTGAMLSFCKQDLEIF